MTWEEWHGESSGPEFELIPACYDKAILSRLIRDSQTLFDWLMNI